MELESTSGDDDNNSIDESVVLPSDNINKLIETEVSSKTTLSENLISKLQSKFSSNNTAVPVRYVSEGSNW